MALSSVARTDAVGSRPEQEHCTIAIVDDQPVSRTGLERVLAEDPNLTLVASVASVADLPAGTPVDAVLLAPSTPADTAREVGTVAAFAHPLVTAVWNRPSLLLDALRAGARGCITRHTDTVAVLTAVRVVASGGFYVCPLLVERFQHALLRSGREDESALAPREVETVRWIALGFTQSQIATRMGLSEATVNTYAKRIRGKLKVNNKAELTRMAIELGYLADDRRHPAA